MAVIIGPKFTRADINRMLGQKKERIYQAILNALIRVGEQFVTDARSNHTYKDVTGNLTSSIGYVVLRDGVQMTANFQGKGSEGISKSKALIDNIASKHQSGLALIVVAGMDYAAAVEARGLDVITNSSIPAVANLKKSIANIASKVKAL